MPFADAVRAREKKRVRHALFYEQTAQYFFDVIIADVFIEHKNQLIKTSLAEFS